VRRTRPTRVRVAHSVALCAAVAALALALREVPVYFVGLAILATLALALPFAEWTSVPLGLARVLPRVLAMTLFAIAGVAWLSRALGALVLEPTFVPLLLYRSSPRWRLSSGSPRGRSRPAHARAHSRLPPRTSRPEPLPARYGASALSFLKGGDHNAFAEQYLVLALVVLGSLWTAAFMESAHAGIGTTSSWLRSSAPSLFRWR